MFADVSSIRGPDEALARRPCEPPAPAPSPPALFDEAAAEDDSFSLILVSDSMSAARMAGSSDFQREESSSGMVVAEAMVVMVISRRVGWTVDGASGRDSESEETNVLSVILTKKIRNTRNTAAQKKNKKK